MCVIITGAQGFVGRHVLREIHSRGIDDLVVGVGRSARKDAGHGAFLPCDLLTPGAGERLCRQVRPSRLLHLAWSLPPEGYWTSRENLHWVQATLELAQAFFRCGGKRMVGVGTCVEYAPVSTPRSESLTPTLPDTVYGQAKLAACHAVLAAGAAWGGSAAWARLFYPFGPGDAPHRLIPGACRAFFEERPFCVKEGGRLFDFMDVRDVARRIVDLLFSDVRGPINIAGGTGLRVRDVLGRLAFLAGQPELLREVPRPEGEESALLADVERWDACFGRQACRDMDASLRDCLRDVFPDMNLDRG